jgi:PIN domain nuclease of toxin-antitoxin system
VAGSAVPAGQVIERGDLAVTAVSGVDGAIAAVDVERVVGRMADVGLVPGQVLTDAMITSDQVPADSERVVGLQLDPARTPAGLSPGDAVSVLAVPPTGDPSIPDALGSPRVLAESATVHLIDRVESGGARVALIVRFEDANRVAAYGAAGRVALVQLPLGGQD